MMQCSLSKNVQYIIYTLIICRLEWYDADMQQTKFCFIPYLESESQKEVSFFHPSICINLFI